MQFLHGSIALSDIVQLQHLPHLRVSNKPTATEARQKMAHATRTVFAGQSALSARLNTAMDALRARRAQRRVFRATLNELSMLSDRELADLGLARSEIRRVAWSAAYER